MGVSYWAYAWTSNERWQQIPDEYKKELNDYWTLIGESDGRKFWKYGSSFGEPSSPVVMGHLIDDKWKGGEGLHFQCISVDDSGYGGETFNPKRLDFYDNLRWKTFIDAERECESLLEKG
tara:strand:- start:160 stop:519 length:360 start_codon:yes stop_codon:yes gene_type:complete